MSDGLELDLDGGPTKPGAMPPWAQTAMEALRSARTLDDVAVAIEPCRTQPESPAKAAVRTAKDAAVSRIRAADRAAFLTMLALVWARLWGWLGQAAGMPPHAAGAAALVSVKPALAPVVAASVAPPHRGEYRKHQGEWRGWIAHTGRAVRPGDRVVMTRRNGSESREFVRVVLNSQYHGGCLIEFGEAPVASSASTSAQPMNARQSIPVVHEVAPESAQEPASASFEDIAAESSANAQVASSGSMAGGQLAGVGFTSAAGYVTALANGVKAATAEGYKQVLRARYGYTNDQILALTVTIIPESTLPVGAGITHGPASSDLGINAMRARTRLTRHGRATISEMQQAARATLASASLIAGLISEHSLLQWSWVGGGETTRGKVVDALPESLKDLAPGAPSAVRQAGDAVDSMRSREYDTARLPSADLTDGIKARWIVGRKLTGQAITAGAAYGEALLVVSLHDDGSLTFEGEATLAAAVRTRYNKSTEHETLRSDVLTTWLGSTLKRHFYAVKRGAAWYVPSAMRDEALAFCEAISPLWGDHETINVTAPQDVTRVLANGIRDEISKLDRDVAEAIVDAQDRAREKATKDGVDPEIAARRAVLTVETAAKLVKQTAGVAARLAGYSGPLPEQTITELRAQLTATQKKLADVGGDDSVARAAMLELS